MDAQARDAMAEELSRRGWRGLDVRVLPGVLTLDGALPATDEALAALEAAWDDGVRPAARPAPGA